MVKTNFGKCLPFGFMGYKKMYFCAMRIVGEIAHPIIKITVLLMNMKYSIKLELGMMEQTFKIRESEYVSKLADIEKIIDPVFLGECIKRFEEMNENFNQTLHRNLSS